MKKDENSKLAFRSSSADNLAARQTPNELFQIMKQNKLIQEEIEKATEEKSNVRSKIRQLKNLCKEELRQFQEENMKIQYELRQQQEIDIEPLIKERLMHSDILSKHQNLVRQHRQLLDLSKEQTDEFLTEIENLQNEHTKLQNEISSIDKNLENTKAKNQILKSENEFYQIIYPKKHQQYVKQSVDPMAQLLYENIELAEQVQIAEQASQYNFDWNLQIKKLIQEQDTLKQENIRLQLIAKQQNVKTSKPKFGVDLKIPTTKKKLSIAGDDSEFTFDETRAKTTTNADKIEMNYKGDRMDLEEFLQSSQKTPLKKLLTPRSIKSIQSFQSKEGEYQVGAYNSPSRTSLEISAPVLRKKRK